jgi:molybdate transport system substrate-binding protein
LLPALGIATEHEGVTIMPRNKTGFTRRKLIVASLLFLFVVGAAGNFALQGAAQQSASITVSAAISLKDALDELGPIFQVQQHRKNGGNGTAVTYNYGGSGTLARQIEQGAPVDVFFSAAEKQMDELAAKGLIEADTRRDLVGNSLVLIAPAQATALRSFQELTGAAVKTIALGEISSVPAGMYAQQTLEHLGLFAEVQKKVVYAKDVRAVLTYVETGNADAGLVYQTDANTSKKARVVAIAPADSHDPILYPVAVLRDSKNKAAARAFVEFLQGSDARAVFQKYGFTSAEKSAAKN